MMEFLGVKIVITWGLKTIIGVLFYFLFVFIPWCLGACYCFMGTRGFVNGIRDRYVGNKKFKNVFEMDNKK